MLIAIPIASKIIMLWIILIGIFFAIMYYQKRFCYHHWCAKDLRASKHSLDPTERFCSLCVEEAMNPKVKCPCGWKGKFHEMKPAQEVEGFVDYYCPQCEKKIMV